MPGSGRGRRAGPGGLASEGGTQPALPPGRQWAGKRGAREVPGEEEEEAGKDSQLSRATAAMGAP